MSKADTPIDWGQVERLLLVLLAPAEPVSTSAAWPQATATLIGHRASEPPWQLGKGRYTSAQLIPQLRDRRFDAAIILTQSGQSPYAAAYLCYLAGIPIRVGQSCEFGGSVLSHVLPARDLLSSPIY